MSWLNSWVASGVWNFVTEQMLSAISDSVDQICPETSDDEDDSS